jgi:hypothetical protein
VTVGVELEAMAVGIVANGVAHGRHLIRAIRRFKLCR